MYADAQHAIPIVLYNVTSLTWSNWYDNKNGSTKNVACSYLANRYPHLKDFPHFPYIGGAWNIKRGSHEYCGSCWNLTDPRTRKTISVTPIDSTTKPGYRYNISKEAFNVLNSGNLGTTWLLAEARPVDPRFCRFKK